MAKRAIVFYFDWPNKGMPYPPDIKLAAYTHPDREMEKHKTRYKFTLIVEEPDPGVVDLGVIGVDTKK